MNVDRLKILDTVQSDRCFRGTICLCRYGTWHMMAVGSAEKSLYVYQTRRRHVREAGLSLQL